MLAFWRRHQESVIVSDPTGIERLLKVTVLEIRGGKVRLGFEAGADLPVHRWEVWERICGNGRPVAGSVAGKYADGYDDGYGEC